MNELLNKINELESKIPNKDIIEDTVSKSSVGWHIEHSLLVINQVLSQLEKSNTNTFKRSFNLTKIVLFFLNKFPRGKAKAPKAVVPKGDLSKEVLLMNVESAKINFNKIETFDRNNNFNHPYFGNLNLKDTLKFLNIHTQHHLDIIDDIVKKSKE
jgi:hypothetical protein